MAPLRSVILVFFVQYGGIINHKGFFPLIKGMRKS